MGGSDQWGNITTGIELIGKKVGGKGYAIVAPLLTKADGTKFGKSESGAIWLDAEKTSPYEFYQFWFNASDEDVEKWIKIFTLLDQKMIEDLTVKHREKPHERLLQKTLAENITLRVHGEKAVEIAQKASQILFGESTLETLQSLDEKTFLSVFTGVGMHPIAEKDLIDGLPLTQAAVNSGFLSSNSELKREIKAGAIQINKQKITTEVILDRTYLIAKKYILLQKGKKKYHILYLA